MPRPKHAAHPDANQAEIVEGLRGCGYLVLDCSQWAEVFDLAVWGLNWYVNANRWVLMEVKTRRGRLTLAQEAFQREHPGAVHVVRNLEDALRCFGRTVG